MTRMIQRAKHRFTTFRAASFKPRAYGEQYLDDDGRPAIADLPAESASGHAENKERAAMVKIYERRVAAGLGVFETPPKTERFSQAEMLAVYSQVMAEGVQ